MSNHVEAKPAGVKRVVFKQIVEGDFRKFEAVGAGAGYALSRAIVVDGPEHILLTTEDADGIPF